MELPKGLSKAIEESKDVDFLVATYVTLRDLKEEVKREESEKLSPINNLMNSVKTELLKFLDESGQEAARTAHGTAYKTRKTTARVADWNFVLDYIKKNDAWDILTHAVSKDAVQSRVEETGEIIPGVDLVTMIDVNVRGS